MVRIHPDPPVRRSEGERPRWRGERRGLWQARQDGAVAQLGERLLCKQEAVGSIPSSSTSIRTIDCQDSIQAWPCRGATGSRAWAGLNAVVSLFNNQEGKARRDLMRVRAR